MVTEVNDYDPFGMVLEGTRYVDESRIANNYKYQGDFAENESWTGWERFELRGNYDTRLGRWHSADPYNQFASMYKGMGNDYINGVDPNGGIFFSLGGALVGAVVGGAVGAGVGYIVDRDNWQKYAIAGAVIGGLYGGFTATPVEYTPNPSAWGKFKAQVNQAITNAKGGYIKDGVRRIGWHEPGQSQGTNFLDLVWQETLKRGGLIKRAIPELIQNVVERPGSIVSADFRIGNLLTPNIRSNDFHIRRRIYKPGDYSWHYVNRNNLHANLTDDNINELVDYFYDRYLNQTRIKRLHVESIYFSTSDYNNPGVLRNLNRMKNRLIQRGVPKELFLDYIAPTPRTSNFGFYIKSYWIR